MTGFQEYQLKMLEFGGILCVFIALFIIIMKYQSFRKKIILLEIELVTAVLLLSDFTVNIYQGDASTKGFLLVRISTFLIYFCILLEVYAFNAYVQTLVMGRDKLTEIPIRLVAGFILPLIGIVVLIVSQVTHWYYSFDKSNCFVPGEYAKLSFVIPFLVLILQITLIVQYHKMMSGMVFLATLFFTVLPIIAAILQVEMQGTVFISLTVGFSAVLLFAISLMDQNNSLMRAACIEVGTGLPNAYGFFNEVEAISETHDITKYCGFYFDIARMALINNRFGRENGDEIIRRYAYRIRETIDSDEVLGRLGGNYFVALIRKENINKFLELLQNVPVDMETEDGIEHLKIAAVTGGYEINTKKITAPQILGYAALALNYAKHVVKKPYVFLTPELEHKITEKKHIMQSIPKALMEEEFELYYQPKVNLKNHTLSGAEVLVRWRRNGEIINPDNFVPLLEQNGSICKIDFYMLEHACRDIVGWKEQGYEVPQISVNFSRKNLGNSSLAEDIAEILRKYRLTTDAIQVEITETNDEYPMSVLKETVEELQKQGITVAIDDFGTGSSTISLLRDINFDVLKIDKTFVDCTGDREFKVLQHILEMAGDMNAKVIAEGVEHKEQIDILEKLGCDEIQGFVFDKPLPKDEFETRMQDWTYS